MEWFSAHGAFLLTVLYVIVSEIKAVIDHFKYPSDSGVGGVVAFILKALQAVGAKAP